MWFKQGQIEVECGDENGYGSGECGFRGESPIEPDGTSKTS